MAVTGFYLGESRDRVTGDHIEFGAEEAVITRIDAITGTGCGSDAAARRAGHGVEVVVRVREPEAVSLDRHAQSRMRFQLKDASHVMDVLERNEIHVAVKFVVGGEQIFKRLMFPVRRIAVAGTVSV